MHQYQQLHTSSGPEAFSSVVVQNAPYFGTIDPLITKLERGCAEVALKNQQKVHNHLGTIHAIAMCNAAELAAGMAHDRLHSGKCEMDTQGNDRGLSGKGENRSEGGRRS